MSSSNTPSPLSSSSKNIPPKPSEQSLSSKLPSKQKSQLNSIKVIKVLLICVLILLIIGSIVLCGLSIDEIISSQRQLNILDTYSVTDLALRHAEDVKQQRTMSVSTIIIHLIVILISLFGIFGAFKEHFISILSFACINTLVMLISLWVSNVRAAIVLLQVSVSVLALACTFEMHRQIKGEIQRRRKERKEREKEKMKKHMTELKHFEDELKANHNDNNHNHTQILQNNGNINNHVP